MNQLEALNLLKSSKHRITRTRELILTTVLQMKSPFSANEIQRLLSRNKKHKAVDLVTIYRNLSVFEEHGIICRSDFSDEMVRYIVSGPAHVHHHHHIVCRECRSVQAIDDCVLDAQEKALKKMGFKDLKHRLEFSGICRDCSAK